MHGIFFYSGKYSGKKIVELSSRAIEQFFIFCKQAGVLCGAPVVSLPCTYIALFGLFRSGTGLISVELAFLLPWLAGF